MTRHHSQFTLFLVGIGIATAVILAIGIIILQRQFAVTHRFDAEYARLDDQRNKIELAVNPQAMRRCRDDLKALDEELTSVDQNMVDYKYIPTYLAQLQWAAVKTGNTIRSISPRDTEPLDLDKTPLIADQKAASQNTATTTGAHPAATTTKPATPEKKTAPAYQIQQFTLEIDGTYSSLMYLLDTLRKFPKMVYVRTVNLTPQIKNGEQRLLSRIETYAIITPDQFQSEDKAAVKEKGL